MDQSFPITVLTLLLLIQGVGSLFLAVILGALYSYRRQSNLLYWTLAWLGNGLWLLLSSLGGESVLQHVAVLCGWLHAALWLLSMQHFRSQTESVPPEPGVRRQEAEAEAVSSLTPDPGVLTPESALFPPTHLAVLLATALAALVLNLWLPVAQGSACLGFLLAGVYLWSALVLVRYNRKVRRVVVNFFALALALYAADRLHYGWLKGMESAGTYASYAAVADFLVQLLMAVALLLFLLDSEHNELSDAVQRLEESEERFRLIVEHSGVGLTLLTRDGRFLQVNPALVRMLGYTGEELRGRRLADLVPQRDVTLESAAGQPPAGATPSLYEPEQRCVRKDGQSIWARVLRVPIRDAGGKARHYVGVLVDITERKRMEEALAASEQRYRLLNQTAHDGIYVTDEHGPFLDANPAFCRLLGLPRDEVLRRTLEQVAEDPVAVRQHQARVVQHGGDRLETRLSRSDASSIEVELSGARLDLEGRRLLHGICRDVSERKRAEEALGEARKMETLVTLVGGIAHDFNNQLTAILGHISLVQRDLDQKAERGEALEIAPLREPLAHAELAAQRCADITQRLLTFSSGKVGATSTLSIDSLLARTEMTLQRELPASIRLQVQRGTDTWPIAGDITQLQQVLLNLAANAQDAMPHGGTLTLAAANRELSEEESDSNVEARPGRFVELSVSDTGIGMTPEVQARLFEPFFTTKQPGQGAGMGLAMVYGIVKAHNGWVSVQSTPGQGSTFRLYLPAAVSERLATEITEVTERRENRALLPSVSSVISVANPSRLAACVLVVDDENLVRALAEAVLQREGYRVLTACDGEEGLAMYKQRRDEIDLVLLDYSMPKLTGLQVFEQLQQLDPQVCVIFSSGYTMDKNSDQLLAGGARAFLPKPYRADDLIGTVRHVLAQQSSRL